MAKLKDALLPPSKNEKAYEALSVSPVDNGYILRHSVEGNIKETYFPERPEFQKLADAAASAKPGNPLKSAATYLRNTK